MLSPSEVCFLYSGSDALGHVGRRNVFGSQSHTTPVVTCAGFRFFEMLPYLLRVLGATPNLFTRVLTEMVGSNMYNHTTCASFKLCFHLLDRKAGDEESPTFGCVRDIVGLNLSVCQSIVVVENHATRTFNATKSKWSKVPWQASIWVPPILRCA